MRRRYPIVALVAVLGVLAIQLSASAVTSASISPTTISSGNTALTITYSGGTASTEIFAQVCNNDQGAAYDHASDCSFLSLQSLGSNTSGTNVPFNNAFVGINGDSGDLGWGCYPDGNATGTVVDGAGVRHFNPCRIHLEEGTDGASAGEFFVPLAIGTSTPPVPEARFALLLPVGGALVLVASFFIVRRRQRGHAEA